ncbi:PEP-CTERM sorting domain-containing protein [Leptothoe sp. PORK10 BA2]|uniref:PEP-CTERM sorting domain-containing protein n=1 Tax=Leptothoe sp. PORK10 BA2 TaxID=3110254 RepID=UPI002B21CA88|nr:PEP-CTERM sorting domain-containing protein [Leptothoe sp. PORK10 BA2]MEA5462553.1 PEP-CTERM sorting domain-containing protein [Leptothoe sp. PORK10 BA2]
MNKPLIFTGVALSAMGLLIVVPAQAGTLTFDFQVDATSTVTVNPFFGGMTLEGITVPNSLEVTADSVAGRFTVLDDPAQFTDGSVELSSDFLDDLLDSSYSAMVEALLADYGFTSTQEVVQLGDNLFNISPFTGGGVLESKAFPFTPSAFNIGYDSVSNTAVLDGYNIAVAESCLSTTCLFDGNVSFGVSLVLSEFVTFTSDLLANSPVPLTPETTAAIANLQQIATLAQLFGPTLSLGTVSSDFSATTDPADAGLDAAITDGVITVTTTIGTEEEVVFSTSFATASEVTEVSTAVPELSTVLPPDLVALTSAVEDPLATALPDVIVAGGSGTTTSGPISLVTASFDGVPDSQDVPEPSILLGLLGTAALLKRGRKKTAALDSDAVS